MDPLPRILRTRWPRGFLVLFCVILWLPGFFSLPPGDRDESRFAQATKQMLESGDVIRIQNGPEARNLKPVGIYWAQLPFVAAAERLGLGEANPIWRYRLPSLLGALLAVLATYRFGIALVGEGAARLAAALLAAALLLVVEHDIAKTDAALLGVTTVAMGLLSRAWLDPAGFGRWQAALFWLALAAGVLLKGPVTPMVAGLSIMVLALAALWRREREGLACLASLRPKLGVPIFLAVTLPWFSAIAIATHGAFFVDSLGHDLGGKITGVSNGHGAPPGTHLLLLPLTLFPASLALFAALPAFWAARKTRRGQFLLAWIVPSWLVFEAAPTKLPHYPLPLFPAILMIVATSLLARERPAPLWLARLSAGAFALALAVLGVGAALLPFVVAPGLGRANLYGVPGCLAAAVIAWAVMPAAWAGDTRVATGRALLLAPLLYWAVLEAELPHLDALWIAPRVAAVLAGRTPAGEGFGAIGYQEPSLRFVVGTKTRFLTGPGDAARFLADGGRVVLVDAAERDAFLAAANARGVPTTPIATLDGFDLGRGRRVTLFLYAASAGELTHLP